MILPRLTRSDLSEILYWYKYNSHVRKKYLKTLLTLPNGEASKDRGASHPSLIDIFVHVLDGYRYFFIGLIEKRPEADYIAWAGRTGLGELKSKEQEVDRLVMKTIDSLTEKDLDRIMFQDYDLRSVLNHMIEEELQHRGEMNALFWQMDVDPPIANLEDAEYVKKHVEGKTCTLCATS